MLGANALRKRMREKHINHCYAAIRLNVNSLVTNKYFLKHHGISKLFTFFIFCYHVLHFHQLVLNFEFHPVVFNRLDFRFILRRVIDLSNSFKFRSKIVCIKKCNIFSILITFIYHFHIFIILNRRFLLFDVLWDLKTICPKN